MAYFVRHRLQLLNSADPEILRNCLAAGDHDPTLIDQTNEKGVVRLTQSTMAAYKRRLFDVLTFVVGEDLYSGADRIERLACQS